MAKNLAEFIGTFAMVFIGCGAIMVADRFPGTVPPGAVPIVFGLIVAAMIYSVGHISGAHFNPAVSLAFTVSKHLPKSQLFGYWVAQFSGTMAASALLSLLLPAGSTFGGTLPHVAIWQAFGWEIVLSFFLMFVIVSVATDTRAVGTMAGAAIETTVTLAAFVGGPISGASMNPARSLAPALFEHNLVAIWIYFAGPCFGAVLAALVYNFIRCHPNSSKMREVAADENTISMRGKFRKKSDG